MMIKPIDEELEKKVRALEMILAGLPSPETDTPGLFDRLGTKPWEPRDQSPFLRPILQLLETNAKLKREVSIAKKKEENLQQQVNHLESLISGRKRMEEALVESQEKYRNILENMEEGYYEVDLRGRFTFFNGVLWRVFGYQENELIGMCGRQFMDQENARNIDEVYNRVYKTGTPVKGLNCEIIAKDGSKKHIELSVSLRKNQRAKPVGFRGVIWDVTEKKVMESELVHTKNFLQNIIESSIDGITITDLHGKIIYASPSMQNILGFEPKEVIGLRSYMLYGNGLAEAKKIMKALSEQGELRNHELRMLKKDGRSIDVNLSGALLKNRKGVTIGTMGIYRDITEKKSIEAQLHQAQKLEALGTLAGGIAHNFNNLLMGIIGNTSLILLDMDPADPVYKRLQTIEGLVQNGSKLTGQLLGYAREGKYESRPVELNKILRETAETFAMTRKEISVHYELADNLGMVFADQGQIEQVLLNLFINAAEAMPQGGRIYLHTKNVTHREIKGIPSGPKKGDYVLLSVRDTGVGMDQQTIGRIFEPFYTTKGLSKATGLSLASSYGIIKAHQGYIKVESQKEVGSIFHIFLPVFESSKAMTEKAVPAGVDIQNKAVLLVDDEGPIVDVGEQMLQRLGFRVFTAQSGQEAMALYAKYHQQIDVVILDLVMPDKNGGETFDQMKALNPGLKVLLSSGYSINGQAGQIMQRGCQGFIQKPFNLEELSKKIHEVIG